MKVGRGMFAYITYRLVTRISHSGIKTSFKPKILGSVEFLKYKKSPLWIYFVYQ